VAGKAKAGRNLNFNDLVAWVDEHWDQIRRVGEAVLNGQMPEIPDSVSDPVQYMSACAELVKANGDPDFLTSLPISFDATCSGLQHLTALTGSEDGKWVNLVESDIAADLYAMVAEKADALLTKRYWVKYRTGTNRKGEDKYKRETFETKDEADSFAAATVNVVKSGYVDIAIDRDIAKQPVGTYYYGATLFGNLPSRHHRPRRDPRRKNDLGIPLPYTWLNPSTRPSVIYLRRAEYGVYTQALTRPKSCPKTATTEVIVPPNWQPACAVGRRIISTAPGRHRLPNRPDPCANGPSAISIGPGNRSIEEECLVQVLVRDNNVDQALKVLKKKMQPEGVFREMKLRGH
jgi:DNA-dependent RNA polymerase/Ribosomal protein S21